MKNTKLTWQKLLPTVLLICGAVGLLASYALTYDKLHVLENAAYQPSCDLNPILSCGSVMNTEQASLFGVPNTIFGLVAFSMLVMFALAQFAGGQFKRWLWLAAQAFATAGVVLMHYLFFEAVFRIHAICPWCFVVWMVTIPIFLGISIYNLRAKHINVSHSRVGRAIGGFTDRHATDLLILWYIVIFTVLLTKFWYYWSTLL